MTKVVNKSLVSQIQSVLRDRIIELNVEPGTRIDIQRLVKEFGVSETPVRVALTKLAQEGFVKLLPRRGYFVVKLTKKDIKEIYDLRIIFESYGIDRAIVNMDLAKLRKTYVDFEHLLKIDNEKERERESVKLDQLLHLEIIRNCNNKLVQELFYRIHDFARIPYKMVKRVDEDTREHIALIKALLEKNKEKAKKLLVQHFENAREAILEALD